MRAYVIAVLAAAAFVLGLTTQARAESVDLIGVQNKWQPYNSQWCVPASVATTLTAYGKNRKVRSIATALGQPSYADKTQDPSVALAYLNRAENKHLYRVVVTTDLGSFKKRMIRAVKRDQPSILFVEMYELPWYHHPQLIGQYHALTVTGYSKNGRVLRLWDPNIGVRWVRTPIVFSAMQGYYVPGYHFE